MTAEPAIVEAPVRLNLGCNQRPIPGYVNVDIEAFPGVDVVADLEKPWPWADDSVDEITCADLPEHIRQWWETPDPDLMAEAAARDSVDKLVEALKKPRRTYGIVHFMNEAWRVLKPGGLLHCLIPSTDYAGRGWAQDPTHVSYWNENTLLYFVDKNGYRALYPHLIKAKFNVKQARTKMPNTMGVTYLEFFAEKVA